MDREERISVIHADRNRKAKAIARALLHAGLSNMGEAVEYVIAQGWFANVEQARLFIRTHWGDIMSAVETYERYPDWLFRDAQRDAD